MILHDGLPMSVIGRDVLALRTVRRPGLLRQVFAAAATGCPALDCLTAKTPRATWHKGALETVAHYLALLQDERLWKDFRS